jgi:tetratricopeptide (TPR) repeat protein
MDKLNVTVLFSVIRWLAEFLLLKRHREEYLITAMILSICGFLLTLDAAINLFRGYTEILTLINTFNGDVLYLSNITFWGLGLGLVITCLGTAYILTARERPISMRPKAQRLITNKTTRRIAGALVLFSVLLIVSSISFRCYHVSNPPSIPIIVLAPITEGIEGSVDHSITLEVYKLLREEMEPRAQVLRTDEHIDPYLDPDLDISKLQSIATRNYLRKGQILIWGWYESRDEVIRVKLTVMPLFRPLWSPVITERDIIMQRAELVSFKLDTVLLPRTINFLSHTIFGVSEYSAQNYQNAIAEFDEAYDDFVALSTEDTQMLNDIDLAAVLFYRGSTYSILGQFCQANEALTEAVSILGNEGWQYHTAVTNLELGYVAYQQNDYEKSELLYNNALEFFKEQQIPTKVARSYHGLGKVAQSRGQYDEANNYYEQALETFKTSEDQKGIAIITNSLGILSQNLGRYEEAEEYHNDALQLFRDYGDRINSIWAQASIGRLKQQQGKLLEAKDIFEQVLNDFEDLGMKLGIANSKSDLGILAQMQGDYDVAEDYYLESLTLYEELGQPSGIAVALNNLGMLAELQNDYEKAEDYLQRALKINHEIGMLLNEAGALMNLGTVASKQGKYEEAEQFYNDALSIFEELEVKSFMAGTLINLGNIAKSYYGDYELAEELYNDALDILEAIGDMYNAATALANLCDITYIQGQYERAVGFCTRAITILEGIGAHVPESLYETLSESQKALPQ